MQSSTTNSRFRRYSSRQSGHTSGTNPGWPHTTAALHARIPAKLLALCTLAGAGIYYLAFPAAKEQHLNSTTFVPYLVTSKEAISPTSFILTVKPQAAPKDAPGLLPYSLLWTRGLWSLEFKQPEVQIARHYTPLPSISTTDGQDGSLSFYIRAIADGEMSNYLSRLKKGDEAWLRGPHTGFDLTTRLGTKKHLVFLAGGTGMVPGMQAASTVLEANQQTHVTLLWAVRRREEVQSGGPPEQGLSWWNFWSSPAPAPLESAVNLPSPITQRLEELQAKYPERLTIRIGVDEENSQFREHHIAEALRAEVPRMTTDLISTRPCPFHDQDTHESISEFQPPGLSCLCAPMDGNPPGKNLFMVSGPDGFVSHFAGPKVWAGGQHTQGSIGGVAAQLRKKNPQLDKEWLVLKL